MKRIWVVSELYYPEETSTGYFLTKIAEGLAQYFSVNVLCSQPTYAARGEQTPRYEVHNRVQIFRCWGTTFNKDILPLRLLNMVTLTTSILFNALRRISAGDYVFVVTNPPSLPFVVGFVCKIRRAKCILIVHDVYPELLVATSMISKDSFFVKILGWLNQLLYRQAERIVVLGRDMQELVRRKLPSDNERVVIIENWANLSHVHPQPRRDNPILVELDMDGKFVLQYAGNMGRTHGLEYITDVAEQLAQENSQVQFLFVGWGAQRNWLEKEVISKNLKNVTIRDYVPRDMLTISLNACDVAIISFIPGMAGISVPSRMYNIMAAGKPIIAIADNESELAQVIIEEQIGWVVQPDDQTELKRVILEASAHPEQLKEMGIRARKVAEQKYSFDVVLKAYHTLVEDIQHSDR